MVDLPSYVSTQTEELAVDAVKNGLQEVSFSWVLTIKQLKKPNDKGLVDVAFG